MKLLINQKPPYFIMSILILLILLIENIIIFKSNNKEFSNDSSLYKTFVETGIDTNEYIAYNKNVFPTTGHVLNMSRSSCLNGGTVTQTSDLKVKFIGSVDSCNLYFDKVSVLVSDLILGFAINGDDTSTAIIDNTNLAYDGTSDKNLRYVGSNPNNYIDIGDTSSLWRIVGVMNNIDDGNGNLETRVKIVRANGLGELSIDSSASSVNTGGGINEWSQADLMSELNGDYLNTSLGSNTYWYNGSNNIKTAEFSYTNVLSSNAQNLIGDAVWHTGTSPQEEYNTTSNGLISHFYEYERSSNTQKTVFPDCNVKYCNDTVERTVTWTGKLALIHPSDYGYATSGGNTSSRSVCLGRPISNWSYLPDCRNTNWLYHGENSMWTLNPHPVHNGAYDNFIINPQGDITNHHVAYLGDVYPAAFLKSNAIVSDGIGTEDNPYIIELES